MNVFLKTSLYALLGNAIALTAAAQPTRITVSQEIIRTADQLPPIGVNNFGESREVPYPAGNILSQASFEPLMVRELYMVKSAGVDAKGRHWITLDGTGTTKGNKGERFADGSLSGAAMRAYRVVGPGDAPLPLTAQSNMPTGWELNVTNADKVIKLGDTQVIAKGSAGLPEGGWLIPGPADRPGLGRLSRKDITSIEKDGRVYYESDLGLRPVDAVIFTKNLGWPDPGEFHFSAYGDTGVITSDWAMHQGSQIFVDHNIPTPEAMFGGDMCLELTPQDGRATISNDIFISTDLDERHLYGQLEPGATYRYEAWLRSDQPAQVTLGFRTDQTPDGGYYGTPISQSFDIDSQWKLYGFEFTAPARPATGGRGGASIDVKGTAPLYIDNPKLQQLYEPGDETKFYIPNRAILNALLDSQPTQGPKGNMRTIAAQSEARMKAILSWHNDSILYDGKVRSWHTMTMPRQLMFLEATGDSPQTRMFPWLVVQLTFGEDEYRGMIEYLAAPYDPDVDTAESKPWAHMRYQQRGHGQPWTDTFSRIVVEPGNENWHNRGVWNWTGFGQHGRIHRHGKEYGLFARYLVDQMRQSPYWTDEVDEKLVISLGGNYSTNIDKEGNVTGYGQEATQAYNGPVWEGHATYIGPRWEAKEPSMNTLDDEGYQRTLMGYLERKKDEWTRQHKSIERLRELGYDVTLVAYEGGPSGFTLSHRGGDSPPEVYGKTTAMAVAAFDGWLDAYRLGWTHQSYLTYGQGRKWRSHTPFSDGFRPSPGFLAMGMRNRLMRGDMLDVQVTDSPTINVGIIKGAWRQPKTKVPTEFPVVGAYATKQGDKLAIAVLSRQLEGDIPVEIELPFKAASHITRHTLTGGPRDHNLTDRNVEVVMDEMPASGVSDGVLRINLAPGNIAIYTITAASP